MNDKNGHIMKNVAHPQFWYKIFYVNRASKTSNVA